MENIYEEYEDTPLFISLGHELIHAINYYNNPVEFFQRVNKTKILISNLEEQKTILGWGGFNYEPKYLNKAHSFLLEVGGNWDEILDKILLINDSYFAWDEKSENGLRSIYGISPRTDSSPVEIITSKIAESL